MVNYQDYTEMHGQHNIKIQYNVYQWNICEIWRWLLCWRGCKEAWRSSTVSHAFGIVTLQPNITSSVTGTQGRLMSRKNNSVQHIPFVNPMKIFLPPLCLNLGLIKHLMKSMANAIQNDSGTWVKYFPKLALQNWKKMSSWDLNSEIYWKMKPF